MGNRRFLYTNEIIRTSSYPYTIKVLVVGGGGGGGAYDCGGGGGGGGVVYNSGYTISSSTAISIIVGLGGTGYTICCINPVSGGTSSFAGTILGLGGGGGMWQGNGNEAPPTPVTAGGAGGGGGGGNPNYPGLGGAGTQGFAGANGKSLQGGGGGGMGSAGSTHDGGTGVTYASIFGTSVGVNGWFSGGGSSVSYTGGYHNGTANSGGGTPGANGTANSGGGGGSYGMNGGAGVVIIRYTSDAQRGTGGNVTQIGSDWQHVFTSNGTYTPS